MTIMHHLDDATTLRYASGDLDEAFCLVVASHLAMCASCRNEVRLAEEVGGELFVENESAELSSGMFDRLMTAVENPDNNIPQTRPTDTIRQNGDVPLPLQRLLGPSIADIRWRSIAPGVKRRTVDLPSKSNSSLYLLNIAPGKAMPEHGHGGKEMTLVLSGAYRDALGRFGPGDIADLDEHVEHQPVVEAGSPCICLVATEAPTRFKGLFGRILQPIVGI